MANIYTDLPRILFIDRVTDAGEYGAAHCPHCGADGRYVYSFRCDDGTHRGAMKGCLSKFPMHPFAKEMLRIGGKEQEYSEKGWKLPSWDAEIKAIIRDFADGEIDEDTARQRIRDQKARAEQYRQRQRGRR